MHSTYICCIYTYREVISLGKRLDLEQTAVTPGEFGVNFNLSVECIYNNIEVIKMTHLLLA